MLVQLWPFQWATRAQHFGAKLDGGFAAPTAMHQSRERQLTPVKTYPAGVGMAFQRCPFHIWATAWIRGTLSGVAPTATQKVVDVQEIPLATMGSSAANGCRVHRP